MLGSYKCTKCNKIFQRQKFHAERTLALGYVFCSTVCFGIYRRTTKKEKKALKAEYDRKYREKNRERDKPKKRAYHLKTYDKEKARIHRKTRMKAHIEYCRQPWYKKWKTEYDQVYRAKKEFGEFWEASLALKALDKEVDNRAAKLENKLYTKSQKRKRQWQNKSKYSMLKI